MEVLTLTALIFFGAYLIKSREQKRRVALLASHLGNYQIEHLMENLTEGYLRCLGENDPERRDQIWSLLATSEQTLAGQFTRFAAEFSKVGAADARVSKFPIALPFAQALFPGSSFDMREALAIHARGIADAVANSAQRTPKSKAFTLSAELFLMQHTCHWFCRSKAVASARLLARHKTSYAQVLDAVAPATRRAYGALVGG
ncbi:hypothetical protein SAMN05444679_115103 [Variovorax sp. CF079]|uniref:hypothetical protein n=1 Tax=Variovorax sp. CF079 TaxID=1882774 RepID=UPI00088DFB96|nr:hypothetical protein [Variovorax sp. CF079]SDD94119.1 hypothetical protein SAMN05444679_115103 [Variovorax sp. CF079]